MPFVLESISGNDFKNSVRKWALLGEGVRNSVSKQNHKVAIESGDGKQCQKMLSENNDGK
jgi:hypothetical protein